jgi:hypothetical protein
MRHLVMLEDDLDRIRRFTAIVATHHPAAQLDVYRTAPAFIAAYSALTSTPCLVCLDHDLFVDSPNDPDPGDGRDVSTFLTTKPAICPVLIHSTNASAADSMMFSMREAGGMLIELLQSVMTGSKHTGIRLLPTWSLQTLHPTQKMAGNHRREKMGRGVPG